QRRAQPAADPQSFATRPDMAAPGAALLPARRPRHRAPHRAPVQRASRDVALRAASSGGAPGGVRSRPPRGRAQSGAGRLQRVDTRPGDQDADRKTSQREPAHAPEAAADVSWRVSAATSGSHLLRRRESGSAEGRAAPDATSADRVGSSAARGGRPHQVLNGRMANHAPRDMTPLARGKNAAIAGILANTALGVFKLVAGVVGNSYALVADAIELIADVASSSIVLRGLQIAGRDPDEQHPFGYGKAEALAGATVALMLLGAAIGIAIEAIREIRTPHRAPAWWTLLVLVVVMAIKGLRSGRVGTVGAEIGSTAVRTDAYHHFSDALTSAAAFVGISIAVVKGPGWEAADDWAALAASAVIAVNAAFLMRPAVADLMDRSPEPDVVADIRDTARGVPGVLAIEKLAVRRVGLGYRAVVHVQADPQMSLHDAHELGATVTRAIHNRVPEMQSVLVHMEPYEETSP